MASTFVARAFFLAGFFSLGLAFSVANTESGTSTNANLVRSTPPDEIKEYRSDYEYDKNANAFYKLHKWKNTFWNAQETCGREGGDLMPLTDDIEQVLSLFKDRSGLDELSWVAYNISALKGRLPSHYTSSRYDECVLISSEGKVTQRRCSSRYPFICKVDASNNHYYNAECDVYGEGYTRPENASSCYKIPSYASTWDAALAECRAEGAHLVVINSPEEAAIVSRLMRESYVQGTQTPWFFHAGFRAEPAPVGSLNEFHTIFYETLAQAGFDSWMEGEPNNRLGWEPCGALFRGTGFFNDVHCDNPYGFICEQEIE